MICTCSPLQNCRCKDAPVTGTGDNPLKELRIGLPPQNPTTVRDYLAWVKFRTTSVEQWVKNDEDALALEGIARIEGDLQQIRHLLKASGTTVKRVIEGETR